jgi:hypothetical protein
VDGVGVVLSVSLGDAVSEVEIEVLSQERSHTGHHDGGVQQDIKQCIQTGFLFFGTFFSLHSRSVQSHIPIGELFQELKDMLNHIIETIAVHFMSDVLDQVLVGCNDPPIHNVSIFIVLQFILQSRVEQEVLGGSLFPSGDVLDQESVGVEPGQEHLLHNLLNSILAES